MATEPTFDSDFETLKILNNSPGSFFPTLDCPELVRGLVSWWYNICGMSVGDVEPVVCRYDLSLCDNCARKEDHRNSGLLEALAESKGDSAGSEMSRM